MRVCMVVWPCDELDTCPGCWNHTAAHKTSLLLLASLHYSLQNLYCVSYQLYPSIVATTQHIPLVLRYWHQNVNPRFLIHLVPHYPRSCWTTLVKTPLPSLLWHFHISTGMLSHQLPFSLSSSKLFQIHLYNFLFHCFLLLHPSFPLIWGYHANPSESSPSTYLCGDVELDRKRHLPGEYKIIWII